MEKARRISSNQEIIDAVERIGAEESMAGRGYSVEEIGGKQKEFAQQVADAALGELTTRQTPRIAERTPSDVNDDMIYIAYHNYKLYNKTKEILRAQIPTSFKSYQELGGNLSKQTVSDRAKECIDSLSEANVAWIAAEIESGVAEGIYSKNDVVDMVALVELPNLVVPKQAKYRVARIADKLQAKLPFNEPNIIDNLTDASTSDIIGDDRSDLTFIFVSRRKDARYGGTVKRQKCMADNMEADMFSLSPEENIERLMNIAIKTEGEVVASIESDSERKESIKDAIVDRSDYGYARRFQMSPVQFAQQQSVEPHVLQSEVNGSGEVVVGWSTIRRRLNDTVGAIKPPRTY